MIYFWPENRIFYFWPENRIFYLRAENRCIYFRAENGYIAARKQISVRCPGIHCSIWDRTQCGSFPARRYSDQFSAPKTSQWCTASIIILISHSSFGECHQQNENIPLELIPFHLQMKRNQPKMNHFIFIRKSIIWIMKIYIVHSFHL